MTLFALLFFNCNRIQVPFCIQITYNIFHYTPSLFVFVFCQLPAPQWRLASPEPDHTHHHGWPQHCRAWLRSFLPGAVHHGGQRSCHGPSPEELCRGRGFNFYPTDQQGKCFITSFKCYSSAQNRNNTEQHWNYGLKRREHYRKTTVSHNVDYSIKIWEWKKRRRKKKRVKPLIRRHKQCSGKATVSIVSKLKS